jgi:hypothetical protein
MTLNPDFRSADDVIIPDGKPTGWTDGSQNVETSLDMERAALETLADDMPVAFRSRAAREIMPAIAEKWAKFQSDKGRGPGSCDWTLLDEFAAKTTLTWLPQIIGSCVISNTFRAWVIRLMYQIAINGRPEEYLGLQEFGPRNFSFFCPWSYGMARRRANMRGGDGLYCEPMLASLMKDGVLPCSTPQLVTLLDRLGFRDARDMPEPQGNDGARLYRDFGNWKYLDELKPYADYRVLEGGLINSVDELLAGLKEGKPAFVCSGIAMRKVGTHRDGFAIHARNPRDSWAHNMAFHGYFVASDEKIYIRHSNESWGKDVIYNVPVEEVSEWFRRRWVTSASIGEIDGPDSAPIAIA